MPEQFHALKERVGSTAEIRYQSEWWQNGLAIDIYSVPTSLFSTLMSPGVMKLNILEKLHSFIVLCVMVKAFDPMAPRTSGSNHERL